MHKSTFFLLGFFGLIVTSLSFATATTYKCRVENPANPTKSYADFTALIEGDGGSLQILAKNPRRGKATLRELYQLQKVRLAVEPSDESYGCKTANGDEVTTWFHTVKIKDTYYKTTLTPYPPRIGEYLRRYECSGEVSSVNQRRQAVKVNAEIIDMQTAYTAKASFEPQFSSVIIVREKRASSFVEVLNAAAKAGDVDPQDSRDILGSVDNSFLYEGFKTETDNDLIPYFVLKDGKPVPTGAAVLNLTAKGQKQIAGHTVETRSYKLQYTTVTPLTKYVGSVDCHQVADLPIQRFR